MVKRLAVILFSAMFVFHIAWCGQFTLRSLVWRIRRFEKCNSDPREWRRRELRYFDIVEEIKRSTSPSAVICVAGNEQLALELAYYAFPRIILLDRKADGAVSGVPAYSVVEDD